MQLFLSATIGLAFLLGPSLSWYQLPAFRTAPSRFSPTSSASSSLLLAETLGWKSDLETRMMQLEDKVEKDEKFKEHLEYSLKAANKNATSLTPALYQAFLQDGAPGWPTNAAEYFSFLRWFATFVPQQSSFEGWKADPSNPASAYQEVYDHLCHFYYLIDQPFGKDGRVIQNNEWFAEWLVNFANVWGAFCDTPDSISEKTIYSFHTRSPNFNITDSMVPWNKEDCPPDGPYTIRNKDGTPMRPNSPSGWLTWNQMFARELNPGLRPIDQPLDNTAIASPADCTFRRKYPIDAHSTLPKNITIKQTHRYATIPELLKGSQYAKSFAKGTFVHFFLGPYSYHRFHTPVSGVIKECYPITGSAYIDVKVNETSGQFDAPDNSEDGYEFTQARGVITIDTKDSPCGNVGVVAVVPIGMAQVSSVTMMATPGMDMPKGTEFGYFLFGGSDIILLFQEGVDPKLITDDTMYNFYGMKIAEGSLLKKQ